jgi:hypothetical protein
MAMNKTRVEEKAARGQTIVSETGPTREKAVNGPGVKADLSMISRGGVSDISASIVNGKVKRWG